MGGTSRASGCFERLEILEVGDWTEDDASRLRRASSRPSLILDFSSSTLRPFLFTQEIFEDREKFSHRSLLENHIYENRGE